MTTFTVPQANDQDQYTEINIQAKIISAETAGRRASTFLAMNVGHLLRAEHPILLLDGESLIWQLNIILTSPQGRPGREVGKLHLDATKGTVISGEKVIQSLVSIAHDYAAG